jgi:hypothetical protein
MAPTTVTGAVRITRQVRTLRFLARAGFAVNGILHAVLGYLTIRIAVGGHAKADPSSAFTQIESTPGGVVVLWALAIGLAALGLWLILGAFLLRPRDSKKRAARFAIEAGKGVAYLALAAAAFTFIWHGKSGGGTRTLSEKLMATPGGLFVVGLIGVGVLVVGAYFVVKGVRRKFMEDIEPLSGNVERGVVALGVWGYVSKGIALAIVGVLFIAAAATTDADQAGGLDSALKALLKLPLGPWVVGVVGAGFIAYGIYSMVRARYARL